MIRIIKELNIEVTKPNIFQAVVAKQYDMNSRFIKATLVDCGTRIDIPPTAKVVINAERNDGQSKGFDGVINEDGTVTVPLHSWMLELEGTVICDISVIDTEADDEKKLTTTSFTLLVEKAAYGGDDVTSDPQYDVLLELIERVEQVEAGVAEAVSGFAPVIRTSTFGASPLKIEDAAPNEHKLNVKVSGKNIIDDFTIPENDTGYDGVSVLVDGGKVKFKFGDNADIHNISYISTSQPYPICTVKDGATVTISSFSNSNNAEVTPMLDVVIMDEEATTFGIYPDSNETYTNTSGYDVEVYVMFYANIDNPDFFEGEDIDFAVMVEYGGDYVSNSYVQPITDFTGVEVSRYGKNLAKTNKVDFPISGAEPVWEGRMTGDFYISWKHNLTGIASPSAGCINWYFEDGTKGGGARVDTEADAGYKISGTLLKVEVTPWCGAKGGSVYDIQLEVGTSKTEYVPSTVQTKNANADGTVEGLTSAPNSATFLISNTSGINIEAEYNIDTKTYIDNKFAELSAAILNS